MSWKRMWVVCQHRDHWKNAKYDKDGQQDGWECQNCGYKVCKHCASSPQYSPCPECGAG